MIRNLIVTHDGAGARIGNPRVGFPVVSWVEDRGPRAPGGAARESIECRIMKAGPGLRVAETGELIEEGTLMFVARGSVRRGLYEDGRPWALVHGFRHEAAARRHYSAWQIALDEFVRQKAKTVAPYLTDGAHVLVAEIIGHAPLELNNADAAPAEMDELVHTLGRAFGGANRAQLTHDLCAVPDRWPVDDGRVPVFEPRRKASSHGGLGHLLFEVGTTIAALIPIVGVIAVILWMLKLWPFERWPG